MPFYVKHTLTDPASPDNKKLIGEQGWVTRYRGPFKDEQSAKDYMGIFALTFESVKFEVKEFTEEMANKLDAAILNPLEFRDEKMVKELRIHAKRMGGNKRAVDYTFGKNN